MDKEDIIKIILDMDSRHEIVYMTMFCDICGFEWKSPINIPHVNALWNCPNCLGRYTDLED